MTNRSLMNGLKAAWEKGNADDAIRFYSDDIVFIDGTGEGGRTVHGRPALVESMREMFGLPGLRFEVTVLFTSNSRAAAEWVSSWTDPASGGRKTIRGASVFEIRDGKVVREASYFNPQPQ